MTETQKHQEIYRFIADRISCGWEHVAAILDDGTVRAYGDNKAQQCNVSDWTDIVKVKCGPHRTVGLKKDGTVLSTKGDVFSNGQIPGADIEKLTNVVDIDCGLFHTVGLRADGTVVACGFNDNGQCDVEGWNNVQTIFAERNHTIALCRDGSLLYCGANDGGALNLEGIRSVKKLYCGLNDTVIVTTDNKVYRTDYDSKTPILLDITGDDIAQVDFNVDRFLILKADGTVLHFGSAEDRCDEVGDWTGIMTVHCSKKVSVGITRDTAYMTGTNGTRTMELPGVACQFESERILVYVQKDGLVLILDKETYKDIAQFKIFEVLPAKANAETLPPAKTIERSPSPHKSGIAWEHYQKYGYLRSRVAGGIAHIVGVMYDGTVRASGANGHKQCNVSGWRDIVAVACSNGSTIGLDKNGSVFYTGKLVNTDKYSPGGTPLEKWPHNIQAISAYVNGFSHMAGLTRDGKVYAYGCNEDGECDVSGWTDITEICIQHALTAGVRKDGTVVLCGNDSAIKDIVSEWTDIEHLYAGNGEVSLIGLKYDGTVVSTIKDPQYDMSAWKDIISISAGVECIIGLTGNGHLNIIGKAPQNLLTDGIDNVLCADVENDVLRITKSDCTTNLSFLYSDGTMDENSFEIGSLAFQNGFGSSIIIVNDGEVVVHVFLDKVKGQGQDETEDWYMIPPTETNTASSTSTTSAAPPMSNSKSSQKSPCGCYVATCVYGSYDCPEVWTLRRFRDDTLASSWYGRAFIHAYYAVSPTIVKWFGGTSRFKTFWKHRLDRLVDRLHEQGVESTPYDDRSW